MRHYLVNKNSKESLIRLGGVSIKPPRSLRYNICNYSNPYPHPNPLSPRNPNRKPLILRVSHYYNTHTKVPPTLSYYLKTHCKIRRLVGVLAVGQVGQEDQVAAVANVVAVVAKHLLLVLGDTRHGLSVVCFFWG